jgi:2-dehydropantoate 2-reductase
MRVLVVGAGAIGGYFGGRLLEAGADVTFLVRPRRAADLAKTGLVIRSPHGDVELDSPRTVSARELGEPFDVILLSCKSYDLAEALESSAGGVGAETAILPLLNGMGHLDALKARFGASAVLGGMCLISVTLDPSGGIRHLNELHTLAFGELDGTRSARVEAIHATLARGRFETRLSETIIQEMWEKWMFIAGLAGITCLMRAAVGDIVAAGAADLATKLLDECARIATGNGFAPSASSLARARAHVTTAGSGIMASMLRDVERGGRTEADHILGDLIRRDRAQGTDSSLLRLAYSQLRTYEARRIREATRA